jgi:hypothetical protein
LFLIRTFGITQITHLAGVSTVMKHLLVLLCLVVLMTVSIGCGGGGAKAEKPDTYAPLPTEGPVGVSPAGDAGQGGGGTGGSAAPPATLE